MRNLMTSVETALKLGVLGAILGYLSLRAHFNTFGIPALSHLGSERYALEAYVFAVGTLSCAVPVVLLGICVLALGRLLRFAPRALQGQISKVRRLSDGAIAAGLLLMLTIVAAQEPVYDIAVGHLRSIEGRGLRPWVFYVLLGALGTGAAQLLTAPHPTGRGEPNSLQRGVLIFAFALIVLALPIVFGASVRDARYPLVALRGAGTDRTECGLAVYQTEKALFIWQAASREAWVRRVELSDVGLLRFGDLRDLRTQIQFAANSDGDFPSCSRLRP